MIAIRLASVALAACLISFPALAVIPDLPDDTRTPGALNPQVTQETIQTTICVSGWTATVRPPVSKTNAIKKQQLKDWNYADRNMKHYEEDHRVPLEVGGNPADPKNLWPQPYTSAWNAHIKDKLETHVKKRICAKTDPMPLAEGQAMFLGNWVEAFKQHCGKQPTAKCNH